MIGLETNKDPAKSRSAPARERRLPTMGFSPMGFARSFIDLRIMEVRATTVFT
jgi:hypothetical protein